MNEKTKDQLLESIIDKEIHPVAYIETGKIMDIWADQVKRSTAIAFLEWVVKNGWSNRDSLENGRIDFPDLYNSFINSL